MAVEYRVDEMLFLTSCKFMGDLMAVDNGTARITGFWENTTGSSVPVRVRPDTGGWVPLGSGPTGLYVGIKMDGEGQVMAALSEAQVERIAERVVELLYERNRRGEASKKEP